MGWSPLIFGILSSAVLAYWRVPWQGYRGNGVNLFVDRSGRVKGHFTAGN